jgi:hypothetical protein
MLMLMCIISLGQSYGEHGFKGGSSNMSRVTAMFTFVYPYIHIGPAHGHIANSMALKNRGIGLEISALGYIL